MKDKSRRKIIVASALMAGAALGSTALASGQMVSATTETSEYKHFDSLEHEYNPKH